MKAVLASMASCALLQMTISGAATSQTYKDIASISGVNLLHIQTALPEFYKIGQNIHNYDIVITLIDDRMAVSFLGRDYPPGLLGSLASRPNLTVGLSEDGLRVERSYINR
jgi:hypothetical protein